MSDTTATAAFRLYRDVPFFGSLNGLRVLCVSMVIWHHSPARGSLEDRSALLNAGYTGVDFFFVLSGFLITTLLLREEARAGRFSLPDFYWRRILRIVPVYFLVVSAVAGYYILIKGETQYIEVLPYYYLFLSNFLSDGIGLLSITWSLAVEEQYYLIWPVLLLLLPMAGRLRACSRPLGPFSPVGMFAAFVVGASLGVGVPAEGAEVSILMYLPLSSYAGLLIGSLIAWALHCPKGFAWFYGFVGWRIAPLATFVLLALALSTYPGALWGWGNLLVHSLMALCIASIVVREDHVLSTFLSFRPIARLGEISYGIYLYHLIGLHVASLFLADAGPWVLTLGMIAVTVVISELSFRFFESHFLRLKHHRPRPWSKAKASGN